MGKKLQSKPKWKAYIRRRQQAQLAWAKSRKRRRRGPTRKQIVPQHARKGFEVLRVPENFCILDNPESVIAYLNRLKNVATRSNIIVDLENVTSLTAETVAVLIATMRDVKQYAWIKGNQPRHEKVRSTLVNSGFFDVVVSTYPLKGTKTGGFIEKRSMKRVDPKVAQELIHLGTSALHGSPQKRKGAYKALIEVMGNTHNHAANTQGQKNWWAMVFADKKRNKICYAFLDTGVGIFRSVRLSPFRRLYRKLGGGNATILHDILKGKVQSSTGIPYRGKGLPAIYTASQTGKINSLYIIANDAYANVSTGEFKELRVQFDGTLLYWETD